jgi:hypothetical protein
MGASKPMIKQILQKFFNIQHEEEMVQYWKTKLAVEAKVTTAEDGSYIMWMEGEKYPFPGFPRGSVLFKSLSKLKHECKQIFNRAWYALEDGKGDEEVIQNIKNELFTDIKALMDERRLLMLPPERMAPMVREIWRAMEVLEKRHNSDKIKTLKEILCFIIQEDDAYRFRVGWVMKFFKPFMSRVKNPIKIFDYALSMLEHAEIVGDMKERQRLLRRIIMLCLKDKQIRDLFNELCNEWDWKKIKLSKGDAYFFRGKWFKVDYPQCQY